MRNEMTINSHGMIKTPEHKAWDNMKQRCFNPNNKRYADYGGRGIGICDRWKNSFENFFADMGTKPSSKHSLDRIDNNGNYSAENCKWSTRKEQENNKRTNRLITIGCVTLTISQWEKEMGYKIGVISLRLYRGWSEFDAVMTQVYTGRLITDGVKILTIVQWENEMGFNKGIIKNRLNLGWSERDAILTSVKLKTKKNK